MIELPARQTLRTLGCIGIMVSGLSVPIIANATFGLFGHGYGSRQAGIVGSGVAFPTDAMAAALNPAGMVHLGKRSDIGVAFFSPMRSYEVIGGALPPSPFAFPPFATNGDVDSESEFFVIPDLGFNWPLDEVSSVGLTIYGNGGMNTDFEAKDTPFGLGVFAPGAVPLPNVITDTGVNYAQLFAGLSYSRKFAGDRASWGAMGILNWSKIRMKGLAGFAPFSLDPARLTDVGQDSDFGVGARIGIQAQIAQGVSVGAAYQTKISNTFDDYAGLFPNGGELDIPPVAQVGLAAAAGPGTLTFDVQYIQYSDSDAIGNTSTKLVTGCIPSAPFSPNPLASGPDCLGGSIGFGWDDMTVFKVGYTWETNGGYTWRVGAATGDQPVEPQEVTFNILAPGVVEEHFTFGLSKKLKGNREVSAAIMYAPEECVKGPDLFTPGKTVELCMHQYQVNFGYSF